MKKCFDNIEFDLIQGNMEKTLKNITIDSRNANKDSLFVCLKGVQFDGHAYINDAYDNGCRMFLVEKDINLTMLDSATVIKVNNTRETLSKISQNFYNHPSDSLITIGITGTKGKTTTAKMIKDIIEASGKKCGLIGTLGVYIGDIHYKTLNTTPESLDIQHYMREMVDAGCVAVVMEVSSQALKMDRVKGLTFDYGIFTNLSMDHIGENEHKDYEEYRECKSKLFEQCNVGILNIDDSDYSYMIKDAKCDIVTFGIENDADYKIYDYSFLNVDGHLGMNFSINENDYYEIFTPGKFSLYNALCATTLAHVMNIDSNIVKKVLKDFKVKGRVEPVYVSDKFTLLIDYAHEAMSLESLLTTIKEYNPRRIVTIFGCGGNRSKLRRYEMGEVSGTYSDLTVLTEDNSRFENVLDIIEDIKVGIDKTAGNYVVIPNRKDAIKYAIENAEEHDIILLCGKGHEDYQEINGVRYHMDERELIQEVMDELKNDKGFAKKKKF